jgi:hypothetical protein
MLPTNTRHKFTAPLFISSKDVVTKLPEHFRGSIIQTKSNIRHISSYVVTSRRNLVKRWCDCTLILPDSFPFRDSLTTRTDPSNVQTLFRE